MKRILNYHQINIGYLKFVGVFKRYTVAAFMFFPAIVAAAEETDALGNTVDTMAAYLKLPMGRYARYFNLGLNVAISEKCAVDKIVPNIINCKVNFRNLEGLLVSKQSHRYFLQENGRLKITASLDKGGEWGKYDTNHWEKVRDSSSVYDGKYSTVGKSMKEKGLFVECKDSNGEDRIGQNDGFCVAFDPEEWTVRLTSVVPVNDKRAFSLTTTFIKGRYVPSGDRRFDEPYDNPRKLLNDPLGFGGGGHTIPSEVTFNTMLHVSLGGGLSTIKVPDVSRKWNIRGRDPYLYKQFSDIGTGEPAFLRREHPN